LLNYTFTLCKLEVSSHTRQQATTSATNRRNSPAQQVTDTYLFPHQRKQSHQSLLRSIRSP